LLAITIGPCIIEPKRLRTVKVITNAFRGVRSSFSLRNIHARIEFIIKLDVNRSTKMNDIMFSFQHDTGESLLYKSNSVLLELNSNIVAFFLSIRML